MSFAGSSFLWGPREDIAVQGGWRLAALWREIEEKKEKDLVSRESRA